MIFGALAEGETRVEGLLEGDDILATKDAMIAFGADIRKENGAWIVNGRGGLSEPDAVIDCGNAGTGVRLIMGAAAAFPLTATFTGDHSLVKRPMGGCSIRSRRWVSPTWCRGGGAEGWGKIAPDPQGRQPQGHQLSPAHWRRPRSSPLSFWRACVSTASPRSSSPRPPATTPSACCAVSAARRGRHLTKPTAAISRLRGGQSPEGHPYPRAGRSVVGRLSHRRRHHHAGFGRHRHRRHAQCPAHGLFDTLKEMGADLTVANARDEGGEPVR